MHSNYIEIYYTPVYHITSKISDKRMCNVYCVTSVALYILVIVNYWKPQDNCQSLVKMAPGPCNID